nr:heme exporter protein CcmB [Bombella favorum]
MAPTPPFTPPSPSSLLQLEHIQLERAGRCLFSDLSLSLSPGDALLLTGSNGAGKSSLLRLIAGLCRPTKGTVTRRSTIAWLGSHNALKPTLTVEQNLRLFIPYDTETIFNVLNRLALAHLLDCPTRLLSLGQKRRVSLARLILSNADLWLLDEPANALDAASLTLLETILAEHRARGGALVIASHTALSLPDSHQLALGKPAPLTFTLTPTTGVSRPHQHSRRQEQTYHPFLYHLRRELHLACRNSTETLAGLLFLIVCSTMFPLALGPSPTLLQQTGAAILWVCTLLACLLPLERLYNADAEDGSLDILQITLHPAFIALGKMLIHWLTTGLPILLATPLLAVFFQLPAPILPVLLASLALGSLTLSLIGGMTAAITLGARRNSLLLPVLTLPLMVPTLIFGTLACAPPAGPASMTNLSLLAALFLLALPSCPFIAGISLEEGQA